MHRKIFTIAFIGLLVPMIMSLDSFSNCVRAQQRKIPKEPFQVVDASTGKLISEFLIIPRYSTFQGISTMLGEGPGSGTYGYYLDKPFIYRSGEPFIIKRPKSTGLNIGFLFVGKGRTLNGIIIVAPKYRPLFVSDLWSMQGQRKLQLTPISDDEWSVLMRKQLNPLTKDAFLICDDYRFWDLPEKKCKLEIQYNRKEREVVRSFLQQTEKETK